MTAWALLCITGKGSGLPEAMKVAVRIYRLDLITITDHKACFRLVSGIEAFSLIALLGLDRNPLDIMLGCHRMLYGSYLDTYLVFLNCINRYVLLLGRIRCSRDDFLHLLSAAYYRYSLISDHGDYVTAMGANEKSLFHVNPPN